MNKIFQLSTRPQIRPGIGQKLADFRPISGQKKLKIFFVAKSPIILPKFGRKLADFRPENACQALRVGLRAGSGRPNNSQGGRASGLARGPQHH